MNTHKIGDIVWLIWNGYRDVPKYLDYSKGEIVGFTRTKIKVKPFGTDEAHTLTVSLENIRKVK